ncbi:MAG: LptM family lipoprotein [Candidatus Wenzhouxiangella sp. M2_3B_020]
MRRILTAAAALLSAGLILLPLGGCGLKGDLVLPEAETANEDAADGDGHRDDERSGDG